MSVTGDYYYKLEVKSVFENHVIRLQGPCTRWRMNLLAVSDRDKNIMFVAMEDMIFVHRLDLLNDKPGEPFKKLKIPVDPESSPKNRLINAIKVGKIGNEEVLVSVDDIGDINIWFTANLDKNPIQFSNNESTWGIALHGPKRLLAVSANSHEITIYNLQNSVNEFNFDDDDDDDDDSSGEEELQTPKTYASVLKKISDNDALGGKAISVLRGHENNIPNICFSTCGRFLVSCSIDATCRIWNVKTGELMQTKPLTSDSYDVDDNYDDWGWTANFVSKSAFKTISSNCEAYLRLTSNPSSPRSVETMDSLDHRQRLRRNLAPNLSISEELYRMVMNTRRRPRAREFEDGFIEDGALFESTEESNEDDSNNGEDVSSDDEDDLNYDDSELESIENDTEVESSNNEIHENDANRELSEIEGSATPAYYDRAESATPVVENYTENNPDYRWSVVHELNILNNNNHDQNDNNSSSISEREIKNNNEERPEVLGQSTQSNTNTAHGSPVQPSDFIISSPQTVSEDVTPASSHNTNFSPETSGNLNGFSPSYSPASFTSTPLVYYYQQNSPRFSPQFSSFSPINLRYVSTSPSYSPASPQFTPFSPQYDPTSTQYSLVSPHYSPTSPTYSPVSPEYIPANREQSPSHSSIAESIIDITQQEPSISDLNLRHDSSPDRHEIESISQSSTMNTKNTPINEDVTVCDNDTICSGDSLTIDSHTSPLREGIITASKTPGTSNDHDRFNILYKCIEPLGSSQSNYPDLGLSPDELVLYTTKYDLHILDPKSELETLRTEKNIVCKVDARRFTYYSDFDRLNMVEVIPELSLMIVASQQGKVSLTRLIKIVDNNGDENYYLCPEKYIPPTHMTEPLLGMFIVKHDTLQDPALFYYRLYLMYCNGTMFCYEIRRKKETNPLRMDNIFI
ncbi:hypothetical protein C1645_812757 [Glomus cerebriforme]|uniref:Uncharacterized protein n=1 Tax=Glomus cerebriforme TaxID=658196 RepID=A0A397TLU4_9GLOM|nr:hypothetical protein C1645_812757 [Glomus cerebriforme]